MNGAPLELVTRQFVDALAAAGEPPFYTLSPEDARPIVGPLLEARAVLRIQFAKLHRMLLELVRTDPTCRRLMSAPGVGPIVALTFRTCVDNPAGFSRSKCAGAHYGLTRAFTNPVRSPGRDGSPGAGTRCCDQAFMKPRSSC